MSDEELLPVDDEETDDVPVGDLAQPETEARDVESEADLEELRQKAAERDELHEKWLRATADYMNLQKRLRKEMATAATQGVQRLAEDLLPVLDAFERAIGAAISANDIDQMVEGIRLVQQALSQSLTEHGVEMIEAEGKPFDPTLHEAVMTRPDPSVPDGTVIEEVRKGYRLGDRVIRASQVVVAKNSEDESPDEQE